MSICNNLKQYGIPYSLTTLHTEAPDSAEFKADLAWFSAVCRIVRGLKNVRFGAIGARPTAFNTVRYSEKLLERSGITVETLDLSEVMGRIGAHDRQRRRGAGRNSPPSRSTSPSASTPEAALMKMAKLGAVIDQLDEGQRADRLRRAVLDLDRGVPRHRSLHRDVDDEREPHPVRLRGRRARHALDVRADAGQRDALRAARLEQQLRRGPQQGRLLPLLQPAQALLQAKA